ncbi:mitochondrial fission process protein 1 [Venturia canescens]|uniref:mitochondrial fission process protein 1 n=1 Tax=Venturia canescens TaxID=32260 RepID=UPI001C9CE871|nr:mitochondrial fission process protein 1 [Venturia canescens]
MKNHVEEDVDIFRDTPVRYLGYTNEVGEAFRSIAPVSIVKLSYVIASGYVLADTIHKGIQVYKKDTSDGRNKRIVLSTTDTLLWQSFASVIVPGLTINRICATVRFMQRNAKTSSMKSPWLSIMVGLVSIPFIIHPIDKAVEETMNLTFREWIGYHPKAEPSLNQVK